MNPIIILQFSPHDPPGHLESFLAARELPFRVHRVDAGDPVPADASTMSGLVLLGSTGSANDEVGLPWVPQVLRLIRAADADAVPVLGHCLGLQLIARAFGARVFTGSTREAGWQTLVVDAGPEALKWTGRPAGTRVDAFAWHSEVASLPVDAVRLLSGHSCDNHGFVLRSLHLALQSHLEITPDTVREWAERNRADIERALDAGRTPGIEPIEEMVTDLDVRTREAHALANRLYDRWTRGLKRH